MKLNPYLSLIIATTIGAACGVIIKTMEVSLFTFTAFRMFIPVSVLFLYFKYKKIVFVKQNVKMMLFASLLSALRIYLFFLAYKYTSITNGVIILYTWPIFATLFGSVYLKEKVTKKVFSLILLAFAGIIVMYSNQDISLESEDFIGMMSMLASALLFAITSVIFKKESQYYTPIETIFYQNIIGVFIFIPIALIYDPIPTITDLSVSIAFGFCVGIGGFIFLYYALKNLKMSHFSLLAYWEIIAAFIFSILFFNEAITLHALAGGSLILLAGILLKKEANKKREA